ncbi:glycosyltransferase family 4 protein [Gordonia sp. NPDC003376]
MRPDADLTFGALAMHSGGTGVSTYAREAMRAIAQIVPDHVSMSAVVQGAASSEVPSAVSVVQTLASRGIVRMVQGKRPRGRGGLFHALDVDLPLAGPSATVATVHDLSVVDVPWAHSAVRARGEQLLLRDSLRRADALIAVSEFTAARIWEVYRREATVTELAPGPWARPASQADIDRVRATYDLPERFILQVGTIEPRKRPHLVAEAARALDIPLVLAGQGSDGPHAPRTAIGLGYADLADLPALYGAATVVTYASVYEGFSLPPVEAMACGATVVASAVGALPDVVGDGAVLVSGTRLTDWTRVLRGLIDDADARAELGGAAIRAAGALTWSALAERTVAVYRSAGLAA